MERIPYYWIFGIADGRECQYGPFTTENEAEREGSEKFPGGNYEVKCYYTKDEAKATRTYKAEKLGRYGSVGRALEKIKHPSGRNILPRPGIDRPLSNNEVVNEEPPLDPNKYF